MQQEYYKAPLNYNINSLLESNAYNGEAHPISIFGQMEFLEIGAKNMFTSLLRMANFIKSRKIVKYKTLDITKLQGFGEAVWSFILLIYKAGWDSLSIDNHNNSFKNKIICKFTPKSLKINSGLTPGNSKGKLAKIVKLPPPIPTCPTKEILEKSKFLVKEKNFDKG